MGEIASELIHIGQSAIHHRDTIEYFLDTTFNVPTYAEAYKDAAYDGLQRLAATSTFEVRHDRLNGRALLDRMRWLPSAP